MTVVASAASMHYLHRPYIVNKIDIGVGSREARGAVTPLDFWFN